MSLSLRRVGFRGQLLDFQVRQAIHNDGREDLFEAANDVTLNHLRRHICDEGLLRNLWDINSSSEVVLGTMEAYLVDGEKTVECFFTTNILHIGIYTVTVTL